MAGQSARLCVPLETRKRSVSVILGKCGLGPGTCDKECASIEVEEHIKCGCGCNQDQHDQCLLSADHVWRQESCQCQCRDVQVNILNIITRMYTVERDRFFLNELNDCLFELMYWISCLVYNENGTLCASFCLNKTNFTIVSGEERLSGEGT